MKYSIQIIKQGKARQDKTRQTIFIIAASRSVGLVAIRMANQSLL
jgi:NADPH:quinone reductase-like Zn-dependent oxidoreductase